MFLKATIWRIIISMDASITITLSSSKSTFFSRFLNEIDPWTETWLAYKKSRLDNSDHLIFWVGNMIRKNTFWSIVFKMNCYKNHVPFHCKSSRCFETFRRETNPWPRKVGLWIKYIATTFNFLRVAAFQEVFTSVGNVMLWHLIVISLFHVLDYHCLTNRLGVFFNSPSYKD